MKNPSKIMLHVFLLSLTLLIHQKQAISQELGKEPEFGYEIGSPIGPDNWGNLRDEWAVCRDGYRQSPVDISFRNIKIVRNHGNFWTNYRRFNATLINNGYDITLQWLGYAGTANIYGLSYRLLQCHWHSPSEHTINGKRYPLEQHLVHQSLIDGTIAVIGILYDYGTPQPFLSQLEEPIRSISGDGQREINVGVMDPSNIPINTREYYRYMGSLTTPACSEGVIWTVDSRVRTVSHQQVQLLRAAVDSYAVNNARPIQPGYGRDIFFYQSVRDNENKDAFVDEM